MPKNLEIKLDDHTFVGVMSKHMVSTMTRLLAKELVLEREKVEDNCPFRGMTTPEGDFGETHRCQLQDWLIGWIGIKDKPMTHSCPVGEIPEVCPMLTGDFNIRMTD
jgi:hypothetical protein